jgi:hypothetical protein
MCCISGACGVVLSRSVRAWGLVLSIVAIPSVSSAQATPAAKSTITVGDFELSPELEIRTRGEYRRNPVDMGGVDTMGAPTGFYTEDPWAIMERTRLGIGADRGALRAKVTFQDARGWGTTPPDAIFTKPGPFGDTGLYEGFIEIHTTSPTPSEQLPNPQYIRIGRQAIVWDGGRLLGNADFSPSARTFDALRAHVGWRSLDFEAFGAILENPRPLGVGFNDLYGSYYGGTQLYGALASLTLDPLFRAQLYGLLRPASHGVTPLVDDFAQANINGDNWTAALGISGDSKGWKYGITGALQFGGVLVGGLKRDRFAGAVVGDASRTFDGIVLTPTIKIGAAYASGGKSTTQYNQFDPLYPDVQVNHGLLGAFAWSNLIDIHGAVSIVPVTDFHITAEYRYVRMADSGGEWLDTYLLPTGNATCAAPCTTNQELGHEVDLVLSYRPWPALNIAAGYSLLILGDGARAMMGAEQRGSANSMGVLVPPDLSHYAFVQLTLNVPAKP